MRRALTGIAVLLVWLCAGRALAHPTGGSDRFSHSTSLGLAFGIDGSTGAFSGVELHAHGMLGPVGLELMLGYATFEALELDNARTRHYGYGGAALRFSFISVFAPTAAASMRARRWIELGISAGARGGFADGPYVWRSAGSAFIGTDLELRAGFVRGNVGVPALTASLRWHPARSPQELREIEILLGFAWTITGTSQLMI